MQTEKPIVRSPADRHLRSVRAIKGYRIETTDGEPGHVKDFIIEDDTWHILFLVIEIHNLPTERQVLIEPKHIKNIKSETSMESVDLTNDALKNMPTYERS